ncbi:MAG: hypothetical protein AAGA10_12515, partial [Bacteroidota bacterium]
LAEAKPIKYVGTILGVPWTLFLMVLVFLGYQSGAILFTGSFVVILLITLIALGTYIYHLVLITKINLSDSILEVQKKLAKIKTSTITVTRIAALQLPFWTTWYVNPSFLFSGDIAYLTVNTVITGLFTYFAVWLFRNIKPENVNKKWIKIFFSDVEWRAVDQARNILNQIEGYEKETKNPPPS